jgi:hypothetical protein
MSDMKRREFIALLGGAAAWPLAARAQQPDQMRRIGVLMGSEQSDPDSQVRLAAFRQVLRQLGWTEGRNIRIDERWGAANPETLRTYVADKRPAYANGIGGDHFDSPGGPPIQSPLRPENFSQDAARAFSLISTSASLRLVPLSWQSVRAVWANGDPIGALRIAARDDVVPSILPEPIESVGAQLGHVRMDGEREFG